MNIIELTPTDLLGNLTEFEEKNAPDKLYLEGNRALINGGTRVSVVGSRNVSPKGIKRTEILVKSLVNKGVIVVSGLAKGVDTIAHTTAINEGGKTITVLGTPLDKAYPAENKKLLDIIKKDHLAVSQFPIGYPTTKKNFPIRNRTMALLSDATIIVEAGEKSGTLHQGWEALRLGRYLYLLESVANNESLTWPKEMIKYGAQVLEREYLDDIIDDIPHFTDNVSIAL